MTAPVTNEASERAFVFLSGSALDIEAGDLGTHEQWAASAREYLARSVSGAAGAATVRVSVAALTVLLSQLDEKEGGSNG